MSDLVQRIRHLANIAEAPGMKEAMLESEVIADTVREVDSGTMYLGIEDEIHAIADEVEKLFSGGVPTHTLPAHDPPVAWKHGQYKGLDVLCCPAMEQLPGTPVLISSAAGIVVLDRQPGLAPPNPSDGFELEDPGWFSHTWLGRRLLGEE